MWFKITGECNLRCPTCAARRLPRGAAASYAPPEICEGVCAHLRELFGPVHICLYDLNEPLLHPDIGGVVDIVRKYGHTCEISSNMNVEGVDLARLLSNPALTSLDMSVSGFSQEVYERAHAGGSVEILKRNMDAIGALPPELRSKAHAKFHMYRDNAEDQERLGAFCAERGIDLAPVMGMLVDGGWHLEAAMRGERPDPPARLDRVRARLRFRPEDLSVPVPDLASIPCVYQDSGIFIDIDGSLIICCVAENHVDPRERRLFVDMTREEISAFRSGEPACAACRRIGIHVRTHLRTFFLASAHVLDTPDSHDAACDLWDAFLLGGHAPKDVPPLLIYGAGLTGRDFANLFLARGLPLRGFLDDSPERAGGAVCGLPCIRPGDFRPDHPDTRVVSCMILSRERFAAMDAELLRRTGCRLTAMHDLVREIAAS